MRILLAVLAIAVLSACGSVAGPARDLPASPSAPVSPEPPPIGATTAVYFVVVTGADPLAVAAATMGRPAYIERAPSGGANPGDGTAPPDSSTFLMPVAPGREADALARFKASPSVKSASLGRYPPFIPS